MLLRAAHRMHYVADEALFASMAYNFEEELVRALQTCREV